MEKELLGRLLVQNAAAPEQSLELHDGAVITIGRSQENTIYVSGETVSRRHAELRVSAAGAQFKNLGRNGAVVNNKSIHHSEWLALANGSQLEVGACKLRVELRAREDTQIIGQTMMLPLAKTPTPNHSGTMILPMPPRRRHETNVLELPRHHAPAAASPPASAPSIRGKLRKAASLFKTPISKICAGLAAFIVVLYVCAPAKEGHLSTAIAKTEAMKSDSGATTLLRPTIEQAAPARNEDLENAVMLCKSAEKLYTERTLSRRNLYDSAQQWREAARRLLTFSQRAGDQARQAENQLQRQIEEWKKDYGLCFEKREYQAANALLQKILEAIPNVDEENYHWAKDREPELLALLNQPQP
jgi:hypothetical protein